MKLSELAMIGHSDSALLANVLDSNGLQKTWKSRLFCKIPIDKVLRF
jgi:hypothetical protein